MAEPEFDREMAEAIENAEAAEVVCVILPVVNQCLVFDSRSTENDPPRLFVSAPLGSAERRLRHTNRARPHLPHARELAVIPWTGSVNALAGSEVWELVARRIHASGYSGVEEQVEHALSELRQWERRALMAMIKGQGPYHTLWSREGA
ncbi:MAG: hypothetical protein VW450_02355 [Chloroflexota bacterium]